MCNLVISLTLSSYSWSDLVLLRACLMRGVYHTFDLKTYFTRTLDTLTLE